MRKFILVLVAISFAAIANAQVYGGGSLALKTNSGAESTQISIVPEIGYVLNDKFAIGAALGLYTVSYEDFGSSSTISIKPYVRYTLLTAGPVSLFTDAAFTYSKPKNYDGTWEIGLYPGISAPISGRLSAVAHIGALSYNSNTTFSLGLSNIASAGLFFNF